MSDGTVLVNTEIADLCPSPSGGFIQGFDKDSLRESSYDIRLGATVIVDGAEIQVKGDLPVRIPPGSYAVTMSSERFDMPPNLCGLIGSKRKLSYKGVILLSGVHVHPGYKGRLLFCLFNASGQDAFIAPTEAICSIRFERTSANAEVNRGKTSDHYPPEVLELVSRNKTGSWQELSSRLDAIRLEVRIITMLFTVIVGLLLTQLVTRAITAEPKRADETRVLPALSGQDLESKKPKPP